MPVRACGLCVLHTRTHTHTHALVCEARTGAARQDPLIGQRRTDGRMDGRTGGRTSVRPRARPYTLKHIHVCTCICIYKYTCMCVWVYTCDCVVDVSKSSFSYTGRGRQTRNWKKINYTAICSHKSGVFMVTMHLGITLMSNFTFVGNYFIRLYSYLSYKMYLNTKILCIFMHILLLLRSNSYWIIKIQRNVSIYEQ